MEGATGKGMDQGKGAIKNTHMSNTSEYGPWMLVEKKQWRWSKDGKDWDGASKRSKQGKSKFQTLKTLNEDLGLEKIGPNLISNMGKEGIGPEHLDGIEGLSSSGLKHHKLDKESLHELSLGHLKFVKEKRLILT